MPSGGGRAIYALGLVATVAFYIGALFINDATQEQRLIEQQRAEKTTAYTDHARVHVERYCARLPSLEKHQCIHEAAKTAREGIHDERDLEAQLVTSVWTHYMGLAAIGGTAFGIIGIFLVLGTFRENKRAADAAHNANRPWLELRAHLSKNSLWVGSQGASADVQFNLMNRGNSPATDVALLVEMIPFPAGQLVDAKPTLSMMREKLRKLDERPRVGSAIFPGAMEEDTLAAEVSAEDVAAALTHPQATLRYLIAVGTSYMFEERPCHTVKIYDVLVNDRVDYSAPDVLQLVKLRAGDMTDTFRGFAT